MQNINALEHHRTSLSLRSQSCRRVAAARKILRRNGITMSESEILSRLAKEYLQRWRGAGQKSATARRYNVDTGAYRIRPWYVDRVLYALLWQRALHSGESISRMLDFAVRFFVPRLLESLLGTLRGGSRQSQANIDYWRRRSEARPHKCGEVFISYQCKTHENHDGQLRYTQTAIQIPKKGLSPGEILHLLKHAA